MPRLDQLPVRPARVSGPKLPAQPPLRELLLFGEMEPAASGLAASLRAVLSLPVTPETNREYRFLVKVLIDVLRFAPDPEFFEPLRGLDLCCGRNHGGPWYYETWGQAVCAQCQPLGVHSFMEELDLAGADLDELERALAARGELEVRT